MPDAGKERPIIMSDSMAQACYEGRKTMTRRVVKPQPGEMVKDCYARPDGLFIWLHLPKGAGVGMGPPFHCPYGSPGDRLWVKEAWQPWAQGMMWRADDPDVINSWRSARCMPRRACRTLLEITSVRVERLQEIRPCDAIQEGFGPYANSQTIDCDTINPVDVFHDFWDSLAKLGEKWEDNPWVWVIGFRRVEEGDKC